MPSSWPIRYEPYQDQGLELGHSYIPSASGSLLVFFFSYFWPFFYISFVRAVSNWVSKVMLYCFGFALLRCVIGPENSRHNLNQSKVKLKPNTTWSLAFSRALRRLTVSNLSSHWLIIMATFFLIGSCDHFGLGCRTLSWNALFENTVFKFVCKYHIKLLSQCQNYKQVNKLFIPTFAVCLEWELVLHLVRRRLK